MYRIDPAITLLVFLPLASVAVVDRLGDRARRATAGEPRGGRPGDRLLGELFALCR
jgi:hypothetical protein